MLRLRPASCSWRRFDVWGGEPSEYTLLGTTDEVETIYLPYGKVSMVVRLSICARDRSSALAGLNTYTSPAIVPVHHLGIQRARPPPALHGRAFL